MVRRLPVAPLLAVLVLLLAVGAAGPRAAPGPLGPAAAAAHPEPGDRDGDEVRDEVDNCPDAPNGAQTDTDGDGLGDTCDPDDDQDGVPDAADNCRSTPNPDQANADGVGFGDACPPVDSDGDGVIDPDDRCDYVADPAQRDLDGDDAGDLCDRDDDNDRYDDGFDNCPAVYNPDQADADRNGRGTLCDPDEGLVLARPGGSGTGSAGEPEGTAPGGPGSPGAPAGPAGPADRTAPDLTLSLARTLRREAHGDALAVGARCGEACTLEARLELSAATARRLGLGSRRLTIARGTWAVGAAGRTYVICRWSARGRTVWRRARTIRATVVVTARDAAGNARSVRRSVTLRR